METPTHVSPSRIFAIEEESTYLRGLRSIIHDQADMIWCGSAHGLDEAINILPKMTPDAVVLCAARHPRDEIVGLHLLRNACPSLRVLLVSQNNNNLTAIQALRAGAAGYLPRTVGIGTFLTSLRAVLAGEIAVGDTMKEQLIFRVAFAATGEKTPLDRLSFRELQILSLVGAGATTPAISDQLELSVKTVESHRLHIRQKLKIKDAAELLIFAREWVQLSEMTMGALESLRTSSTDIIRPSERGRHSDEGSAQPSLSSGEKTR